MIYYMSVIPQHVPKNWDSCEINCDILTSGLLKSSIDFHMLTDFHTLSIIKGGELKSDSLQSCCFLLLVYVILEFGILKFYY